MTAFQVLTCVPTTAPLWRWLWREVVSGKLGPAVGEFLTDPQDAATGALRRVGDTLVWDAPQGQRVVGHLEALSESQDRIGQAVNGIGTAQVALTSALGAVRSLSMLTLGVTSLTGVLMLWRLNALRKRHDDLAGRIRDIEGHLTAIERAHLQTAIGCLNQYETERQTDDDYLKEALFEARKAAHIYKNLASDEAQGRPRIEVLNYRGRMYLLALLTELRCCILAEDVATAHKRITEEEPTLGLLARTTFTQTVGDAPEEYLRPEFRPAGITLEGLAEVYGQAHAAGAVDGSAVRSAGDLFEHLRDRLAGRRYLPVLPRFAGRSWRATRLRQLQYAVCCVEETNRVRSLKLLLEDARQAGRSVRELSDQLAVWKAQATDLAAGESVLAYRLA